MQTNDGSKDKNGELRFLLEGLAMSADGNAVIHIILRNTCKTDSSVGFGDLTLLPGSKTK